MLRSLLTPRWVAFHVLVAVAVVVMVLLGFWQLDRLQQRRDFNATVRERAAAAVVPIEQLVPAGHDVDPDALEWRTVSVRGEYVAGEDVVVVNRSQTGRAGRNAVAPLRLGDGRLVLVNRGFVPQLEAVPPPPSGEVEVVGRVRPSQERAFGQLSDPADGELREVQRIDLDRLAPQLPGEVVPVYVDLLVSRDAAGDPAEGALPEPLPDPELDEGPHLSYALQWWTFSALAVVGWVLAVRRSTGRAGPRRQPGVEEANAAGVSDRAAAHGGPRSSPASDAAATAPSGTPPS